MKFKESDKIAGVVVLNYTDTFPVTSVIPSPPYSNDLSCPNRLSSKIVISSFIFLTFYWIIFSGLYQEDYSTYCDQNPWNFGGDGLLFEDLLFPIFFLNESSSNHSSLLDDVCLTSSIIISMKTLNCDFYLQCYFKFNQPNNGNPPDYPLCAIELKAFMWAAVDTPTCLRRGRLNMLLNPQPCMYTEMLVFFKLGLTIFVDSWILRSTGKC